MSRYPNGDPLEEARLLLPWYITGKLNEPEKELVERMLDQNPTLKAEYEREVALVEVIRENQSLLQLTAVDTTGQRLEKLMRRIEREAPTDTVVSDATSHTSVADSIGVGVSTTSPKRSPSHLGVGQRIWQFLQSLIPLKEGFVPANAVFASLLALQVGFVGWYAWYTQPDTQMTYQSATATTATNTEKGLELLVDFNDRAQVQQVREFLLRWNARIVDGPDVNANSFFRVEVKGISAQEQQADEVVQQMQQEQAIINFAGKVAF